MGNLNARDKERYSRNILLKEIGLKGQEKLLESSVLIIGAGGLGSPVATYLAAAGVGQIGIIDGDRIDLSNLQRQILFDDRSIGEFKAETAVNKIAQLNQDIKLLIYNEYLTIENAEYILGQYDVIVNGTDNFTTRYLINDTCIKLKKPLVDASAVMFEGQVTVFMPGKGCYRCLYPSPPELLQIPTCGKSGVIGALVGTMGSIQSVETIKVLLNIGDSLETRLIHYNALTGEFNTLNKKKRDKCLCSLPNFELKLIDSIDQRCAIKKMEIHSSELLELISGNNINLLDVRDKQSYQSFHIIGSRLININEIMSHIKIDQKNIIICQFGTISLEIQNQLMDEGINEIYSLAGGISEWMLEEYPLVVME